MDYPLFFNKAAGHDHPRDYQSKLAGDPDQGEPCASRLIHIPTGMGKTAGVVLAWLWNRHHLGRDDWPRRLVYCLPMRTLVEQTLAEIRGWLCALGIGDEVHVQLLLGGADSGDWHYYPEADAILVGTQDMLLSRALNRGYGIGRARWPAEFGLLHTDCLWVLDEVQLMDVGLATATQLQAFRDQLDGGASFSWWTSATLQPDWLTTPDTEEMVEELAKNILLPSTSDRDGGLWKIEKPCEVLAIPLKEDEKCIAWAERIWGLHGGCEVGEHGRISLVVVNTVDTAVALYRLLNKMGAGGETGPEIRLAHSRFRGAERQTWAKDFLCRTACSESADRIIISTQIVEAGVDISAGVLVTELAPWPSLVQRFGRAARYGGTARVVVVDRGASDDKSALPYSLPALEGAREAVGVLEDASLSGLAQHQAKLEKENPDLLAELFPYDPDQILTSDNVVDLFDTTPDLDGADIDISPFIRSGEERDVSIYWRAIDGAPAGPPSPLRDELCSVSFLKVRGWIGKGKTDGWIWDYATDRWDPATPDDIYPGRTILISSASGGYSTELGWTGRATDRPPLIEPVEIGPDPDRSSSSDRMSVSGYKTIATHSWEVGEELRQIAGNVGIDQKTRDLLSLVAILHDWGKSHPAFQEKIKLEDRHGGRQDMAKAPEDRWQRGKPIRHELASALATAELLRLRDPGHAALEDSGVMGRDGGEMVPEIAPGHLVADMVQSLPPVEFDLLIFLVASHHGKVRGALSSTPHDQEIATESGMPILGVLDGDLLPPVSLAYAEGGRIEMPEITLHLDLSEIGLSALYGRSWGERVSQLLADGDGCGVFRLAYLESIVRAADCRASALTTPDPDLG